MERMLRPRNIPKPIITPRPNKEYQNPKRILIDCPRNFEEVEITYCPQSPGYAEKLYWKQFDRRNIELMKLVYHKIAGRKAIRRLCFSNIRVQNSSKKSKQRLVDHKLNIALFVCKNVKYDNDTT